MGLAARTMLGTTRNKENEAFLPSRLRTDDKCSWYKVDALGFTYFKEEPNNSYC